MAQDNKIQMPGVFGGLMRYDDEYKSKFMMSPSTVIAFIVAIIVLVLVLKIFFPISGVVPTGFLPFQLGGFNIGKFF
jgi:preprotein translocase subunit Sec61beta